MGFSPFFLNNKLLLSYCFFSWEIGKKRGERRQRKSQRERHTEKERARERRRETEKKNEKYFRDDIERIPNWECRYYRNKNIQGIADNMSVMTTFIKFSKSS